MGNAPVDEVPGRIWPNIRPDPSWERCAGGKAKQSSRVNITKQKLFASLIVRILAVKPQDAVRRTKYLVPKRLKVQVTAAVSDEHHCSAANIRPKLSLPFRGQTLQNLLGGEDEFAAKGSMRLE